MNEREKIIHLWFDMWLQQKDLGMLPGFLVNKPIMYRYLLANHLTGLRTTN